MHDFYLMVLAVVMGVLLVKTLSGAFSLIWPWVERGLEKWAA